MTQAGNTKLASENLGVGLRACRLLSCLDGDYTPLPLQPYRKVQVYATPRSKFSPKHERGLTITWPPASTILQDPAPCIALD